MISRYVRLKSELQTELERLSQVVDEAEEYATELQESTPNSLELRGAGAIVHDFYNGVEAMSKIVANEIDGGLPQGESWHSRLLETMALDLPEVRPPLFAQETVEMLDKYRRFRHVFRHSYGFYLVWERVAPLLRDLPECYNHVEHDVKNFFDFLTDLKGAE